MVAAHFLGTSVILHPSHKSSNCLAIDYSVFLSSFVHFLFSACLFCFSFCFWKSVQPTKSNSNPTPL